MKERYLENGSIEVSDMEVREMMKLKIFGEVELEDTVYVKLRPMDDGVVLCAVNRLGDEIQRGWLLTLTAQGTVVLHPSVSQEFGFQLDDEERIEVEGR